MTRSNYALTPSQRNDARKALALLAPLNLTLEQAALLALNRRSAIKTADVSTVADEFLRSRLTGGARSATYSWYEERINTIVAKFGDRPMAGITRGEFKEWLAQVTESASSRAATARAARAFWRYALQKDPPLVHEVVTQGLEFQAPAAGGKGSTKFLTVPQCRTLLLKCQERLRSALALMLFAGIRPEEMAGDNKPKMRWEHVNCDEQIIRVPAEISKTGEARIMEGLPETVWAWLTPQGNDQDVLPTTRRTFVYCSRELIGMATWPQDCLRHSFATYAVASTNNPGQVAMWLGHNGNPTMLYRHYRGLTTKAEAEKFFALRP